MAQYSELLKTLAEDMHLQLHFLTDEQKKKVLSQIAEDPEHLLRADYRAIFFMDEKFMEKCVKASKEAHLSHLKAMEKLAKAQGKPGFEKGFIKASVMALEEKLNKYISYRQSCYVQTRVEERDARIAFLKAKSDARINARIEQDIEQMPKPISTDDDENAIN